MPSPINKAYSAPPGAVLRVGFNSGAPAIQVTGNDWTPNVNGSSVILSTDYSQLPQQWLNIVTNKIDDLVPPGMHPSGSRYGALNTGADGLASIINAWGGMAVDYVNQCGYLTGGGHTDAWGSENGVFRFEAAKGRWTVAVARGAYTDARYWNGTSFVAGTIGNGNNCVQLNGGPASAHSYDSPNWCPPGTVGNNTSGYFVYYTGGVVNGTTCSGMITIADLDTGTWLPAWWKSDIGQAPKDFSYSAAFVQWPYMWSPGLGSTSRFYAERYDLSQTEVTTHSAVSIGLKLSFAQGFNMVYGDRMLCKMPQRGEIVNFSNDGGALTIHRYRLDDAIAANSTANVASYEDTITLTGDTGDFTAASFNEGTTGSRGLFWAAGNAYDPWADCLWIVPNATGAATYRVSGLNGNTWTVTKYASGTTLTRSPIVSDNGTYGRLACFLLGGIKCLYRVVSTLAYVQVRRCPDN